MKRIENFDITSYNSYRVKSVVKEAFFPESVEDVAALGTSLNQMIILGGGNNIIISQPYYDDTFIILRENLSKHTVVDKTIEAESGIDMALLSEFALEHSLSGIEVFWDIPSTLGGAVFMNAGNAETCIGDLVHTVWALNKNTGEIEAFNQLECNFSYRKSVFQLRKELVVLKAKLQLKQGKPDDIKAKMEQNKAVRHSKQPVEFPNCGSVFKRPEGYFVGTMIEQLGLKGYSIGGAQVSEKHAGFIVNKGDATGDDILNLVKYIQEKVFEAFSVNLELEQVII